MGDRGRRRTEGETGIGGGEEDMVMDSYIRTDLVNMQTPECIQVTTFRIYIEVINDMRLL